MNTQITTTPTTLIVKCEQTLTRQCVQAVSSSDVPHLDGGVSIAGHEDVGVQLHARGERLVARQRVLQLSRLHVPYANGRVQRTAHYVDAIELEGFALLVQVNR